MFTKTNPALRTLPQSTARKLFLAAASLLVVLLGASLPAAAQAPILFAQIDSAPPLQPGGSFVNIPGLALQLPAATATQTSALITLNVPQPYASGSDYPGALFAIAVNHQEVARGGFTYSMQVPQNPGRMPFSLVVKVDLAPTPSQVAARWRAVRTSTCYIDSFASLSAVIGN